MKFKILACFIVALALAPSAEAASTCSEGFFLMSHLGLCLGSRLLFDYIFSVPIRLQHVHKRNYLHELH